MAEEGAIALYLAHVTAEKIRPRLRRGQRVLDFGDRVGGVTAHLEAAGVVVARGREASADRYDGAFAEVGEWDRARAQASGLAGRLAPGAPVLLRLARRPAQPVGRVLRDLGPSFSWSAAGVLGLLVPREDRSEWAEDHPHAFAALCAAEGAVRLWPCFRLAGREALLLGARRTA
jgi:hypothetical protein